MRQKLLSVILTLAILMSAVSIAVSADIEPPATLGAPEHFGVGHYYNDSVNFTLSLPQDIRSYIGKRADDSNNQSLLLHFQVDYKIDNGSWHHTSAWDSRKTVPDGLDDMYSNFINGQLYNSSERWSMTSLFQENDDLKPFYEGGWDYLKDHSITFRARFAESFDYGETTVLSPWSKEYTLSANAKADYNKLINHAPTLLSAEVKLSPSAEPYFEVRLDKVPGEVQELNSMASGSLRTEIWMRRAGDKDFKYIHYEWANWEYFEVQARDYFEGTTQSFEAAGYEIKTRYSLDLREYKQAGIDSTTDVNIYSPFSNVISHNMPAWSNASAWASAELKKADDYGLIQDSLKGADMTKPITREEFAELAVKLYEKTTGTAATAASPNPFTDTNNPEILKAFKVGVTTGTSATTFAPKELTNREQVATMLSRAIRVMAPGGDFSTTGAPSFSDKKDISSWALDHVLFMARLGIIKGTDGKFMPKATTTAQTATGYATTTREQAIAMSVRSFEQMDTIKASKGSETQPSPVVTPAPAVTQPAQKVNPTEPSQPLTESGSIVGKWGKGTAGATYNAITRSFDFGVYGTEQEYQFNSDGTFTELIKTGSGSVISTTGDYTISGGMLTLTYKSSKESSDFGETWTSGNTRQPTSHHYELGKDGDDSYLMIGFNGGDLPLDTETNAVKYWHRE